jgi:hypothetical protein
MQIHVARHQQQLGVFAAADILAGLSSGRFLPSDLAWREGMAVWTPLGDWAEFRGADVPPSPSGLAQPADAPAMPSWERGASVGNFIATIKEVALDPVRTFANLRDGGYARPISFTYWSLLPAWLCGSLLYGALFGFMATVGAAALPRADDPFSTWIAGVGPLVAALAISAFLGVFFLFVPLFNFVGAGITYLLLLPWGPSGGYAQTYRANAYAYGAFMPFAFIPCLNYVAMPWQLVAAIIAHSQVHRIAWWKVTISLVVIPCLCVCGIYAMLFAVVAKNFAG